MFNTDKKVSRISTKTNPFSDVPTIAKRQIIHTKKTRIIMQVDEDIVAEYKAKADKEGKNYHQLMNDALKMCLEGQVLIDEVKRTIREELGNNHSQLLEKA